MEKYRGVYRIESVRLDGWDYGNNASYFVKICTIDKNNYFGKINDGKMYLSEIGIIARTFWQEIPQHFSFIKLSSYAIMPNHLHGIITINKGDGGARRDVACNVPTLSGQSQKNQKTIKWHEFHQNLVHYPQSFVHINLLSQNMPIRSIPILPGNLATTIISVETQNQDTILKSWGLGVREMYSGD